MSSALKGNIIHIYINTAREWESFPWGRAGNKGKISLEPPFPAGSIPIFRSIQQNHIIPVNKLSVQFNGILPG